VAGCPLIASQLAVVARGRSCDDDVAISASGLYVAHVGEESSLLGAARVHGAGSRVFT